MNWNKVQSRNHELPNSNSNVNWHLNNYNHFGYKKKRGTHVKIAKDLISIRGIYKFEGSDVEIGKNVKTNFCINYKFMRGSGEFHMLCNVILRVRPHALKWNVLVRKCI